MEDGDELGLLLKDELTTEELGGAELLLEEPEALNAANEEKLEEFEGGIEEELRTDEGEELEELLLLEELSEEGSILILLIRSSR